MTLPADLQRLPPQALDLIRFLGLYNEPLFIDDIMQGTGLSSRVLRKWIRRLVTRYYVEMQAAEYYILTPNGRQAVQTLREHDATTGYEPEFTAIEPGQSVASSDDATPVPADLSDLLADADLDSDDLDFLDDAADPAPADLSFLSDEMGMSITDDLSFLDDTPASDLSGSELSFLDDDAPSPSEPVDPAMFLDEPTESPPPAPSPAPATEVAATPAETAPVPPSDSDAHHERPLIVMVPGAAVVNSPVMLRLGFDRPDTDQPALADPAQAVLRFSAPGCEVEPDELAFTVHDGRPTGPHEVAITPLRQGTLRIAVEVHQFFDEYGTMPVGGLYFDLICAGFPTPQNDEFRALGALVALRVHPPAE